MTLLRQTPDRKDTVRTSESGVPSLCRAVRPIYSACSKNIPEKNDLWKAASRAAFDVPKNKGQTQSTRNPHNCWAISPNRVVSFAVKQKRSGPGRTVLPSSVKFDPARVLVCF